MCGRYYFDPERDDPLTFRLNQALKEIDPDYRGGEIFPGTMVPALVPAEEEQFQLALFHWGFPVHFSKRNLINARSETVTEKQTFREPFETARIAVPAHGYYEWDSRNAICLFFPVTNYSSLLPLQGNTRRDVNWFCSRARP